MSKNKHSASQEPLYNTSTKGLYAQGFSWRQALDHPANPRNHNWKFDETPTVPPTQELPRPDITAAEFAALNVSDEALGMAVERIATERAAARLVMDRGDIILPEEAADIIDRRQIDIK